MVALTGTHCRVVISNPKRAKRPSPTKPFAGYVQYIATRYTSPSTTAGAKPKLGVVLKLIAKRSKNVSWDDELVGKGVLSLVLWGPPSAAGRPPCLRKKFLLVILSGLGEVVWLAQVAPMGVVGWECEDFFSEGCQAEIDIDDGERALFFHQAEETRRDDVDAGEGERLQRDLRG